MNFSNSDIYYTRNCTRDCRKLGKTHFIATVVILLINRADSHNCWCGIGITHAQSAITREMYVRVFFFVGDCRWESPLLSVDATSATLFAPSDALQVTPNEIRVNCGMVSESPASCAIEKVSSGRTMPKVFNYAGITSSSRCCMTPSITITIIFSTIIVIFFRSLE